MRITLAPMLLAIVAVAAPPIVACGDTEAEADDDKEVQPTAMPEEATCPDLSVQNRYAALSLGPSADGAVFYSRFPNDDRKSAGDAGVADAGATPVLDFAPGNGTLGTVCGGATDRAACFAKVRAATATAGWPYALPGDRAANEQDYGVVTKGDDVRIIITADELRALVAPIESLAEAAAVAKFSNRNMTCGTTNARTELDGYVLQLIAGGCGGPKNEYLFEVHRDGAITDVDKKQLAPGDPQCVEGRRPAGYVAARRPWLASLPAHLAEIAHMEAAAVVAFAELASDLAARGAPPELLARVERARRDEIDHAAIMTARAHAYGETPPPIAPREERAPLSLLELALLNASEGCVRELYGALVAAHQATHARAPALRAAFERIARDEAEHAALSLDLRDWLATHLDANERALVAAAEEQAWSELARECESLAPSADVERDAGMPNARVARTLLDALRVAIPAAA